MKLESAVDGARCKRSLIMKIGSAVLGVHIAVLCAFSLTQGCLTSGSDSPSTGARHKGPFMHKPDGKSPVAVVSNDPGMTDFGPGIDDGTPIYTPIPIDTVDIEPNPNALPPVSATATESYIVRSGDTLSQLAVDFDTTTAELVRINNLANPDVLYVGQELRVPAGRRAPSSTGGPTSSTPTVKKGGTYVIQKGDTLSQIALAAGVSIDALRQLNNIQGDRIIAGETLSIPEGGTIPPTRTQSQSPSTSTPPSQSTPPSSSGPALDVPAIASPDEGTAPEGTAPSVIEFETHTMYPGETLDEVAREYGITKAEIMRLNGITDESQIRERQSIRIPIAE